MIDSPQHASLPDPLTVDVREDELEALLEREWLLSNKIGAYASSSVVGCNTRRYHGLLIAADPAPAGRIATLSTVMEELVVDGEHYELAVNEFPGSFTPNGATHLAQFRDDAAITFVYRVGGAELIKEIVLAESANAVALRYTLNGAAGELCLRPFVSLRSYHELRRPDDPHNITYATEPEGVVVQDRDAAFPELHLLSKEAAFEAQPQWWRQFKYRADIARGQDGIEDLYTPGRFRYTLGEGESCQFTASLRDPVPVGVVTTSARRRDRLAELAAAGDDELSRRLAVATDAFIVKRAFPDAAPLTTILAGYPWFADWGRDAFIALPGLLLSTGRFGTAREAFRTFGEHLGGGMVPNRFDEYSSAAHYNSIDASLWYVAAADRYAEAGDDADFWRHFLMPTCDAILRAYQQGTQFDIHADADGLLTGGSHRTQLTWMDAALGDEVVTSRNGKAVEVNALWYHAHRVMAQRCRGIDDALADHYAHQADLIAPAFVQAFWCEDGRYLYDCVGPGGSDASIRPNQIFAVSLPHSPLAPDQQADVVRTVTQHLLTPRGLRTLSPADERYRGRYGGSWESRDRAYHQGTVWAWLIGAFTEAYLKVEDYTPFALAQARQWLDGFDDHLHEACLGQINEIFDGDSPHAPCGCVAQAWSVAEVLRARQLVRKHEMADGGGTS